MNINQTSVFRALLLAGLGAAMVPNAARAQARPVDRLMRTQGDPYFHTTLGLCEDYPEESTTDEIIEDDLDLLNQTGIDLLRISFGWDGIENSKDQYDWLFWDQFVSSAVDDHGITLIPYICYTPLWNSTNDDIDNFWHYPPKDYDEFGEFVFDLVNRYKDRIKTWELWNEPDIQIFWAGDQDEFAKLIRIGSEAVRRADPEAKVVLGGLAHDPDWLESLFRDHGVSPYVDIVNMHNYYETWADKPLEEVDDYINRVAHIVDLYGDGQTLWMAEVGYSTFRDSAYVSDSYSAYYAYEHTPEYQAVDLIRRISIALATEKLSALAWYEIKDLNQGEDTIGDFGNNGNLGIVQANYTPKPAQRALKFFNELMAQPERTVPASVETDGDPPLPPEVHAFEQKSGDVIVVAWLPTFDPNRTDEGSGDHRDDRTTAVRINIPRSLKGEASSFSPFGDTKSFDDVTATESGTQLEVTLRGGSVTILKINKI